MTALPGTGTGECGERWPLEDPGDEDARAGRTHLCWLAATHHPPHRCYCGASFAGSEPA